MPIYTLPNFNLLASFWNAGNTPNTGPPDTTGANCQLYVYSRAAPATDWTPPTGFKPSIFLRSPYPGALLSNGSIIEIPLNQPGDYYLVIWRQRIHMGFPNEYLMCQLAHCDGDGMVTG